MTLLIVIYFAAHGAEAQIQGQEEMTQMIFLYDASARMQNKDKLPVILGILKLGVAERYRSGKGDNSVRFFTDPFFSLIIGLNRRSY